MATQIDGPLGGFRGKLGPVVGYMRNGRWCVRSLAAHVSNPRTARQTANRRLFKRAVQLASSMRWVVDEGLRVEAAARRMTGHNLFVHLNTQAVSMKGGRAEVDYTRVRVAEGGLSPVAFGAARRTGGLAVEVPFSTDPDAEGGDMFDTVKLYAYCPDVGSGYLSNGNYRHTGLCTIVLPQWMDGHEVHLYGFVRDSHGLCSPSQYLGAFSEFGVQSPESGCVSEESGDGSSESGVESGVKRSEISAESGVKRSEIGSGTDGVAGARGVP